MPSTTVSVLPTSVTSAAFVSWRWSETTRLYDWPGATSWKPSSLNVLSTPITRVAGSQSTYEPTRSV